MAVDVALSQDLWDEELALIVAASADDELCYQTYLPPKMTAGQAKRWFFGQKHAYFVQHQGKPVGMVVFHPKPGKWAEVEVETWLLAPYRRLGISAAAHPLVVQEAGRWWERLTAWVWETNEASLGLLRHTGFVPTGKSYVQDGTTCVQLVLPLKQTGPR
jgi:RimJ/RimL family protein N-acetyltransferase